MKEWTLMFYFASDNELAPVIISQLKGLKDAGFQEKTDVLVHFDPTELGVPTRVYDVNRKRKKNSGLQKTMIGDGPDPFVRNMAEDAIDPETIDAGAGPGSAAIKRALINPDSTNAEDALRNFLGFCRENHRAKRYMLFLVGHGMVVGNDAFLPDDNPVSAITLRKLGAILNNFTTKVKEENGAFELLALHSCCLSAIEVAYELKGTANFMMASEGPSFVGSWPYRQLLKKIFSNLEKAKRKARREARKKGADQGKAETKPSIDMPALVKALYFLTLFNATDFLLAGYSHDLALCSLDPDKFCSVTDSIKELVAMLKKGLQASSRKDGLAATERGKRIRELVLLAHWEAQSYWGENYTDLFDFCRCLSERCNQEDYLEELRAACFKVMRELKTIVIQSENFGSKAQYSHGLSIYFPWSRPIETLPNGNKKAGTGVMERFQDEEKGVLERYSEYAFTKELRPNTWLDFLESYFDETKRLSRKAENGKSVRSNRKEFAAARASFPRSGPLSGVLSEGKPSPLLAIGDGKPSPLVGIGCACPSIKNYPEEPEDTKPEKVQGKSKRKVKAFAITEGALRAFE